MKQGDYFDLKGVSFEDFIKLHQFLEDKGYPLYTSTKRRIEFGKLPKNGRGGTFSHFGYDGISYCGHVGRLDNELSISDFINQEDSYEIY